MIWIAIVVVVLLLAVGLYILTRASALTTTNFTKFTLQDASGKFYGAGSFNGFGDLQFRTETQSATNTWSTSLKDGKTRFVLVDSAGASWYLTLNANTDYNFDLAISNDEDMDGIKNDWKFFRAPSGLVTLRNKVGPDSVDGCLSLSNGKLSIDKCSIIGANEFEFVVKAV